MRVGGQRHAPAALPPGKTRYPLYRRLGGPVWTGAEYLAPTVINIRRAQVKVGLINLCKGLFSLNSSIYYKLKSGTLVTISV
jgi:hypothetical protein